MLAEEFRKAPFLRLLLPLAGGICLGRECCLPPMPQLALAVLAGILLFLPCGRRGTLPGFGRAGGGLLLAAFFLAGIDLGSGTGNLPGTVTGYSPGITRRAIADSSGGESATPAGTLPEGFILARVCGEPEPSQNGARILVDRIRRLEGDQMTRAGGRASLFLAGGSRGIAQEEILSLEPGSLILARCRLRPYPVPLNPAQFDYGAYQRGRGIWYRAYVDSASWLKAGNASGGGPAIRALRLRRGLIQRLEERIPGRAERDILKALLLGYRETMDPGLKQNFTRSGTLHILAVSGLHVGIVYLLPAFLLKILKRRRVTAIGGLLGTFALLWGYALLTGLSTSVIRAVCMCCIHATAMVSRRKASSFQVVSLAAFLMIAARPAAVFEAGFQLSFAAVTGILLMYRKFRALFSLPGMAGRWLSRMLSLSLSAQLASLPLAVFYFHQASPLAFLANLAVVPLGGLVLYLGLLFFLFSGCPPAAGSLAFLLGRTAALLDRITGAAAVLPGSWIGGLSLIPLQVVLLYATGLCILYFLSTRTYRSMFLALSSLGLLLGVTSARELHVRMQRKVCVFALQGETAILFMEGRNAALFRGFGDDYPETMPYGIEDYCLRRRLRVSLEFDAMDTLPRRALRFEAPDTLPRGRTASAYGRPVHGRGKETFSLPGLFSLPVRSPGIDAACVEFSGMRILILGRWQGAGEDYIRETAFPEADLLVLCNNPAIDISSINLVFGVPMIVADGSNRPGYVRQTGSACRELGLRFYYTGEDGCFEENLRNSQKKYKSFR